MKQLKQILIVTALCYATLSASHAARVTREVVVEGKATIIAISGEIDRNTKQQVMSALANTKGSVLVALNSPGGLMNEALALGYRLRERGVHTIVASFDANNGSVAERCYSACVYLLASGVTRDAMPNSKIGVHRFYTDSGIGYEDVTQHTVARELIYLKAMGVSSDLLILAKTTAAKDMHIISREKAILLNLLTPDDKSTKPTTGDVASRKPVYTGTPRTQSEYTWRIDPFSNALIGHKLHNSLTFSCNNLGNVSITAYMDAKSEEYVALLNSAKMRLTVDDDLIPHAGYFSSITANAKTVFKAQGELSWQAIKAISTAKYGIGLAFIDHTNYLFNSIYIKFGNNEDRQLLQSFLSSCR